jgi:Protein of unknown function (DUF3102)
MSNVVSLTNKRDWKWHRDRIAAAWGKQVESIIETGQYLIEAKEELGHGSFQAMVQKELPFVHRTAQMLMKIARNTTLSNARHASLLPPSWMTLNELTKLPNDLLIARLKDGSIHPKLERKDVRAMRPDIQDKPKPATREELIAAIQKDPLANQRDAAAELGVSLGEYQRTRNELIGSGQLAPSELQTGDQKRQAYVAFVHSLSEEDQVKEVVNFFKRELKWTTKEIGKFLNITSFKI